MEDIIGLKELRENVEGYARKIAKGHSFIVVRRSKPLFRIAPVNKEEEWETVIDFTKLRRGGIPAAELLSRL